MGFCAFPRGEGLQIFIAKMRTLDARIQVDMVYFDFSKALDKVQLSLVVLKPLWNHKASQVFAWHRVLYWLPYALPPRY